MGQVVLARRRADGVPVAIKRLHVAAGHGARKRLEREGRTLALLDSENIVRLLDVLNETDEISLVLEYVEGPTLAAVVATQQLRTADALALISQLSSALRYVHSKGLVHRDVKPSNVMLSSLGVCKLNDFGVVRLLDVASGDPLPLSALTRQGLPVGTAAYMSPEAIRGDRSVDQRADLYSLGVLAYQLLTGRHPFPEGVTLAQTLHAHLEEAPPPPQSIVMGFPAGVADTILKALEKEPDDRQHTVEQFWAEMSSSASVSWPAWRIESDLVALARRTFPAPADMVRPASSSQMAAAGIAHIPAVASISPAVPRLQRRRRVFPILISIGAGLAVGVGVFELVTQVLR